LSDIDQLYNYINKKGELYGEWYFRKSRHLRYWNYLHHYSWLSAAQQNKLTTGCLNIILFMAHDYIQDNGIIIRKNIADIANAVNNFQPGTAEQKKLWFMVKEALILCERKINGVQDTKRESSIYQSITWTLKHTVLNENPS